MFVGLQAAGKTTFYQQHLAATHVHVSKDRFPHNRNKNRRQETLIREALAGGRSVAVDNTNPTPAERAPLLALAREVGARPVACWFPTTVPAALRRNATREGRARVPDVAIFTTAKRLRPPTREEGFAEVRTIRTSVPSQHTTQQRRTR